MKKIKLVTISLFCMALAGCLSPVTLPQKNSYELSPGSLNLPKISRVNKTLLVMETQTTDALDSKKMKYVTKPFELANFTKNVWVESPAKQLTALITRALQKSNHFKAVVSTPFVGVTDLKLNTFLYKLQQNFLLKPSREQLVLSAQLMNASSGKIIAQRTFSYSIKTLSDNPYGGVVAANKAVKLLLQDLTRFVVGYTH